MMLALYRGRARKTKVQEENIMKTKKRDSRNCLSLIPYERAGIRTPDNLIKSQVLYRLS